MKAIQVVNSAISDAINKNGDFYKVFIGQDPFTPAVTILESDDVNCGAMCNELEFARIVSDYYVQSFDLDVAEDNELQSLINSFIDMPRRGEVESDSIFRNRYRFVAIQNSCPSRTTRSAIFEALRYFVADVDNDVQIIEPFSTTNLYFQIRIEGTVSTDGMIFLDSIDTGWLDQYFIAGVGIGEAVTYLGELVQRIKAAGVDFDILFIEQDRFTKTSDAFIGTIQFYKLSDAVIKAAVSFTKTSDAVIV